MASLCRESSRCSRYVFVRTDNAGVGVRGYVRIPTASHDEGLGTGKADFGADIVASGTLGESFGVAANAGFLFRGDPDFILQDGNEFNAISIDAGTAFRWGVGANFPAKSSVQGIVELTGELNSDDAEFEDATDLA